MCFYREHLIRLQHENKMLKLAQEGSDNEKIALLQSLLEDANRRKNELETENRSAEGTETCSISSKSKKTTLRLNFLSFFIYLFMKYFILFHFNKNLVTVFSFVLNI